MLKKRFSEDCYHKQNRYLIDQSQFVIARL
jgi:hypothetical protein